MSEVAPEQAEEITEASGASSRWLAREFAELAARGVWSDHASAEAPAFDVLIVGSGYGGAVAAWELADLCAAKKATVCLLERGREYLPGAFPARMADLPKHVRGSFAGKRRGGEQLFDIRAGADVNVVLANGLGGGSLINAGVMETPAEQIFDAHWPKALNKSELLPFYEEARLLLGARKRKSDGSSEENTIARHLKGETDKTRLLRDIAGKQPFKHAAITVAMRDGDETCGGVKLNACKRCGDCASGCNYGSKESLDTNLLAGAARQGVEIFCGATVLRVESAGGLWHALVCHTDPKMQAREGLPKWIAARTIILAAGTLGSTEILLRSQRDSKDLRFSTALGKRFSANGDSLLLGYNYAKRANAIADEDALPGARGVGPTITGVINIGREKSGSPPPLTIEEMAIPGPIRRFAEEVVVTADALRNLGKFECTLHRQGHPSDDAFAVHPEKIDRTVMFATMGDDGAGGMLQLSRCASAVGDGQIDVIWPDAKRHPLFRSQLDLVSDMAKTVVGEGRTIPNPLWQFLPPEMEFLVGDARGPIVTVHPLGGCAMADSRSTGVVNEWGQVFDGATDQPEAIHRGLYVLDGSIIPTSLCTNPALTITALALRAMRKFLSRKQAPERPKWQPLPRPIVADIATEIRQRGNVETRVGFTERLAGRVNLSGQDCWVELTLTYQPQPIRDLFAPRPNERGSMSNAELQVGKDGLECGRLRVFLAADWDKYKTACLRGAPPKKRQELLKKAAIFDVAGKLIVFERARSNVVGRLVHGACAWARNRGVRDVLLDPDRGIESFKKLPKRLLGMLKLATRAGEIRTFWYELEVVALKRPSTRPELQRACRGFEGEKIRGSKRITYARPSNPWRQLLELTLTRFPAMRGRNNVLALDPEYLAARGRPLFAIVEQREHAEALMDVASLAGYIARMLLNIHVWSMRKPDLPTTRDIQRLPGKLRDLPEPEIHTIEVDRLEDQPVTIRLTRYRSENPDASLPPMVMLHGYSASGTTFAHPALKPSLGGFFAQCGRDVWIVDLRTSAGLPTGSLPWTMERVGLMDVPAAIDYVWWKTGERPIDVIAHCMGAVMFSMAVLSADRKHDDILSARDRDEGPMQMKDDRFFEERRLLPARVRRVVLSQNGPLPVLTQANIFRGYVMSYFSQMFGPLAYDFRPKADQGLVLDLMDRLFATVPYPDGELKRENSWHLWRSTRFVGTRHRIDALYNRAFKLSNLSCEVLDKIDDFFGPMNLDTLSQVIQFAQHQTITNRAGRNRFVRRDRLGALWNFPTLSVHGEENGLADVAMLERMDAVFTEAGVMWRGLRLPGRGHQDALIGEGLDVEETFQEIRWFLSPRNEKPWHV